MGLTKQPPTKKELLDFLDNHTNKRASEYFNVSDKTFTKWLRQYGITHKLRDRKDAPAKKELEDYLKKHTLKDTEQFYSIKTPTLRRWLDELGMQHLHFDQKNMISLSSAAKELGLSRTILSVWFRHGWIPGAVKVNATRVKIPRSSIEYLKLLRSDGQLT